MGEPSPRNMKDYPAEYARFRWERPERFNFAMDVVDRWAEERPGAPALLHCDERGGHRVYTWAELSRRSIHAALFLRGLGLQPGDGVFTMLPRLAEWWLLALGCMRANLVLMPGTTMLTAEGHPLPAGAGAGPGGGDHRRAPRQVRGRWARRGEGLDLHRCGAPAPWTRFQSEEAPADRAADFPPTRARRPDAGVLHQRDHRDAEDGAPDPRQLRHRARGHREVLARPRPGRPPLHPLRHRLGEVRLGQGVRPLEPGGVLGGLRLPGALRRRGAPHPPLPGEGDDVLRAAHRLAGAGAGGLCAMEVPGAAPRDQRRRAAESRGDRDLAQGHRAHHPRGVRSDRDGGHRGDVPRPALPGRLDGQAVAGVRRAGHRPPGAGGRGRGGGGHRGAGEAGAAGGDVRRLPGGRGHQRRSAAGATTTSPGTGRCATPTATCGSWAGPTT